MTDTDRHQRDMEQAKFLWWAGQALGQRETLIAALRGYAKYSPPVCNVAKATLAAIGVPEDD